jgi:hypothetical protein
MRMIIEARISDGVGSKVIRLAEFERLDGDLKQLGCLNLAEGRDLVREAQRALVCAQTRVVVSASLNCPHCGRALSIKAIHAIRYRTVFGKVTIDSPQLRVCKCVQDQSAKSFSPLAFAIPLRVSPELEHLQVKWAASSSLCNGDEVAERGFARRSNDLYLWIEESRIDGWPRTRRSRRKRDSR